MFLGWHYFDLVSHIYRAYQEKMFRLDIDSISVWYQGYGSFEQQE